MAGSLIYLLISISCGAAWAQVSYDSDAPAAPAPATAPAPAAPEAAAEPAKPSRPKVKGLGKPRALDEKAQEKTAKDLSKISGQAFLDYYKARKKMTPAQREDDDATEKLTQKSFEKFDKTHNDLTNQMLRVTPPAGGEKKRFDEGESRASKNTGRTGTESTRSKPGADKAPGGEEVKPGTASWIDFGKGGK